jgi:hypothetical protein
LAERLKPTDPPPQAPLLRLFDIRSEFPGEWARFVDPAAPAPRALTLNLSADRFRGFDKGKQLQIS